MKGIKEMLDQSNTETQQGRYQICSSMSGSWESNIMATTGLQQAWVALSLQPPMCTQCQQLLLVDVL